jgi:hypothetical protein
MPVLGKKPMNTKKMSVGIIAATLTLSAPLFSAQAFSQGDGFGGRGNNMENRGAGMGQENGRGDGRGAMRGGVPFRTSDEAVSACSGKSQGGSCSFTTTMPGNGDKSVTFDGTCQKARKSETDSVDTLSCLPTKKDIRDSREERLGSEMTRLQKAEQLKALKSRELTLIETRVGKLIDFLKTKSVDTDTLESEFATLKAKGQTLLDKTDAYVTLLKNNGTDSDVAAALEAMKSAGKDMRTYFHDTLRPDIKKAIDSLKD